MRIAALATRIPGRCIDNQELLGLIETHSSGMPAGDLERYLPLVESLLRHAGAETRYIRDRERGETAHDLILEAMRGALADLDLTTGLILGNSSKADGWLSVPGVTLDVFESRVGLAIE